MGLRRSSGIRETTSKFFLKSLLGVRKTVPTAFIYIELGVFPLRDVRLKRIIKYWIKILNLSEENPVKIVYKLLVNNIERYNLLPQRHIVNWAATVKKILEQHGFGYIWQQQYVNNVNTFLSQFEQRINDMSLQYIRGGVVGCSDNRMFRHLTVDRGGANYLTSIKEKYIRIALARIRLGSHNFMVERGRWVRPKIAYELRICQQCEDIEDEYHVTMICTRFTTLRKRFLPKELYSNPSMYKFINFINTCKEKDLKYYGIFCHKVFIQYNESFV